MMKCFERVNVLISDNDIVSSHIKKYAKDFDFTILGDISLLVNFKKIDTLIIDFFHQGSESQATMIKNQINNILGKIYINNILNLTNFRIEHSTNFRKPFALGNLLNYIHEKTKNNSLFIYLNNSFLYDEIASRIEYDFNTVNLTSKENKILKFMLGNKDYKSNKLELSEKIWGHNREVDSSTVEHHMYKLKNKLPDNFLIIQGLNYFLKILS